MGHWDFIATAHLTTQIGGALGILVDDLSAP
jgi:hypothetical protein